jgi:hypothetical protein
MKYGKSNKKIDNKKDKVLGWDYGEAEESYNNDILLVEENI